MAWVKVIFEVDLDGDPDDGEVRMVVHTALTSDFHIQPERIGEVKVEE